VDFDNTWTGMQSDNVQDAIEEINTKIAWTQTVTLDWNIVLNPINMFTNGENSIYHDASSYVRVYNTVWYMIYHYDYMHGNTWGAFTYDKYLFIKDDDYSRITKLDLTDLTTEVFNLNMSWKSYRIDGWKVEWDYIYATWQSTSSWALIGFTIKIQISNFSTYENITWEEYNAAANYANSINWLFYAQDGNDYVATDINGTEVKRYVWIGTVTWIANGKLWRTVWDVSYAIAII
jgi:hypothetical protein